MPQRIYLVTGANKGIGNGLVAALLSRPGTTVIAGVRDPAQQVSRDLGLLPVGEDSRLITVKLDSTSSSDPIEAAKALQSEHGITTLDVVIANAGIMTHFGTVLSTPPEALLEHFQINTIAPLQLISAMWPLMERSPSPQFYIISSNIASLELSLQLPIPALPYGVSKLAANFIIRKLHLENPSLVSVALNPGWVQTDMGWSSANSIGVNEVPVTVEQSVRGLLHVIDTASREKTSGKFVGYDGAEVPW
ncbi:hypothetical protein BP6252_11620 [Coleophoma cylindrospora]|uniref:Aflatoxin biosynthesis ketoreductase nor-1 n=1 Tax=Coleophoma cylindrospora TaxID=1849047 RepID=A0A3D8QKB1_9HELO|nr:hypothetical protein BP6252_11620 [Coleophoma cylindrospora]